MEHEAVLERVEEILDEHEAVSDWEEDDEDDGEGVVYRWRGDALHTKVRVKLSSKHVQVKVEGYRSTGSYKWVSGGYSLGIILIEVDALVEQMLVSAVEMAVNLSGEDMRRKSRMRPMTTRIEWEGEDDVEPWRDDDFEVSVEDLLEWVPEESRFEKSYSSSGE